MGWRDSDAESSDGRRSGRWGEWLVVDGSRIAIAGGVVVGVFLLTWILTGSDVLTVRPGGSVPTTFGSGVVAGVFTVITVTLAINQLIASRVFGAPDALASQFDASRELRHRVADLSGHAVSPTSTVEFVAFVGDAMYEHAESVGEYADDDVLAEYVERTSAYADTVRSISPRTTPARVISTIAGSEYAHHIHDTEAIRDARGDQLSEAARDDLEAILELLRALAISRQYYKTITLQQELAELSRLVVFTGLPALLVAIYVPMLYRSTQAATVPPEYLPVALSAALAVIVTPLALLLSYLLRISTIMRYTVSVGPFAPPAKWPWER